jgi:hypothetical protein
MVLEEEPPAMGIDLSGSEYHIRILRGAKAFDGRLHLASCALRVDIYP